MRTSAQVVETPVNVITNSPSQDYTHLDDHNLPTYVNLYCNNAILQYFWQAGESELDSFSADDIKDFTPPQVVEFLAQLVDKVRMWQWCVG